MSLFINVKNPNLTTSIAIRPDVTSQSAVRRSCGACVACCTGTLRLTVDGQEVDRGSPCRHCRPQGCHIYATRPTHCRSFECGWLVPNSPLPQSMRPDRCGAILLLGRLHWEAMPVDLAVATEGRIPQHTLNWLIDRALKHRRPLIYQADDVWQCVGPLEFGQRIQDVLATGRPLW